MNSSKYVKSLTQKFVKIQMFAGHYFHEYYDFTEGTVYYCGNYMCYRKYTTYNGVIYHVKNGCKEDLNDDLLLCPYNMCKKVYRSKNGLRYHVEKKHQYQ